MTINELLSYWKDTDILTVCVYFFIAALLVKMLIGVIFD